MNNTISKDEMHLLNQMALDDDFLFEALEGASAFEETNKVSLSELKERLDSFKRRKNRSFVYWIGAAASILIIIFAVQFFDFGNNLNETIAMEVPSPGEEISLLDMEEISDNLDSGKTKASKEEDLSDQKVTLKPKSEITRLPVNTSNNSSENPDLEESGKLEIASVLPAEEESVIAGLNKPDQGRAKLSDENPSAISPGEEGSAAAFSESKKLSRRALKSETLSDDEGFVEWKYKINNSKMTPLTQYLNANNDLLNGSKPFEGEIVIMITIDRLSNLSRLQLDGNAGIRIKQRLEEKIRSFNKWAQLEIPVDETFTFRLSVEENNEKN